MVAVKYSSCDSEMGGVKSGTEYIRPDRVRVCLGDGCVVCVDRGRVFDGKTDLGEAREGRDGGVVPSMCVAECAVGRTGILERV